MDSATIRLVGERRKGFRIAELSRRSGIPVATIKYYLREGLLPAGELTSPNQARYFDQHVHRLRLIRALIELAQVPIAGARDVLAALDSDISLHERLGTVHRAVTPGRRLTASDGAREAAAQEVRDLLERRRWAVGPDAPAIGTLVETIAAMRSLGQDHLVGHLDAYADAMQRLAELEVSAVTARPGRDRIAESVVIGTILGELLVASLRLLAQEDVSARRLAGGDGPGAG
jgi:DNA-binding transcriptional MerR regulator